MSAGQLQASINARRYQWRAGVHLPVDAQAFGEWIESLPDREPDTLIDAARDPKSVAHKLFDWNDATAAREHRLSVARRLYGCLCVEAVIIKRRQPVVYQVQAIVRGGRDEPYEPIDVVLRDPSKRGYRLSKCLRELTVMRREYATLQELALVFAEVDALNNRIRKRRRA